MSRIDFMPEKNASEAMWLKERLEPLWGRGDGCNYVASIIPRGYQSYAKIFHPAYLGNENREITWRELAQYFNRQPHSQMQWHKIVGDDLRYFQMKIIESAVGHLPRKKAEALIEVLSKYTKTPDDCLFGIWTGWGGIDAEKRWPEAAAFQIPEREYILLRGPIQAAASTVLPDYEQSASLWWPRDRAWCVATEIDMMWTFVGSSTHCIEELLEVGCLEVYHTNSDDRVDINADMINT